MNYTINQENYHDFKVFEDRKLPPRSYFIPFPNREAADAATAIEKRYISKKTRCLNGTWDFKFYEKPAELPDAFATSDIAWDQVPVPSCWQTTGYMQPFYVNTRYQFPCRPPHIPTLEPAGTIFSWIGADKGLRPRFDKPVDSYNSVGVYRTFFSGKKGMRQILSFLGVASCLEVHVNGVYAGYSEGSHNTAEFDITRHCVDGQNELVCIVRRWCNGSYLEAQDMFRNNGIFRDVLLYSMEKEDIWDYTFYAAKTGSSYDVRVSVEADVHTKISCVLKGHGIGLRSESVVKDQTLEFLFSGLQVEEWSAENPVLYTLYLECQGTCISTQVGFMDVRIQKDRFLINDKAIKLHGVNHHDSNPRTGYYMTPQDILKDVMLCKEYNIDTIRTSHYPPDPFLLELCDSMGIYVVDEADLETHGFFSHRFPPRFGEITNDSRWEAHYLDRGKRLYERDKNHPSIVMWSLGNESGGYKNTDAMYAELKKKTNIPIHYESVVHSKRKAYDVGSQMYPSVEAVHAVGEHKSRIKVFNDRPYFLCEYAHAMGVGPGGAEDYWKEIYSHHNLMGGCIWEMTDHAMEQSPGSYTYGGDHGEYIHDGNFCVDGIFYPDRTPSTGARIARHLYRPLRITHIHNNQFQIFNTTGFTPGNSYLVTYTSSNGQEGSFIPQVAPQEKEMVYLELSLESSKELLLHIEVIHTTTRRVVSRETLVLEEYQEKLEQMQRPKATLTLEELIPGETILFRAPTDNDINKYMKIPMKDYLQQLIEILKDTKEQGRREIHTRIRTRKKTFLCKDIYEETNGGILLTSHLHCEKGRGTIPRFGKTFVFPQTFSQVEYYGREFESYRDMKEHGRIQKVNCVVSDMTEPNIRPQESGNRTDCRYVILGNGQESYQFTAVGRPFELGIKPYSDRELLAMKHREDERTTGTYLTIQAFQMGIGTGICGPETAKEHCFSVKQDYTFSVFITKNS